MSRKDFKYRDINAKMSSLFNDYSYLNDEFCRLLLHPDWIDTATNDFAGAKELFKKYLLVKDSDFLKKYYKKVKNRVLSNNEILRLQFFFFREKPYQQFEIEAPLRDHLANNRINILSTYTRFKGKKSVVEQAGQIRIAFIRNHVSTDVFNCVRYNEVLSDPFYWLDLTIEQFIHLEDNLELLIAATKKANEIGAGNEGYDEQLEIRQEIMQKIGFIK
ncbi:hypothetical protein [Pasteurella multocida]|uniref:hypothetical protein n=1 Tax=Pasteurella multocida TaxID=747 RepID=UPI0007ECEB84|nr:hypothetical protein [Pasteurella multocida]MCL7839144.1 hypothetical protein [Pasteurella multocida]OBP35182.1 hypothetical protein A0R69_04160 [Pasteurella multocida subsp. multocida]PNM09884.1 hypothetical protein A6J59_004115 [Pasteurella multocida]HDR1196573.1 hypothetical protein [Pasteurella multocida]HDR1311677.1 hypothetical protein [Pasteurella multocida]